MHIDHFLVLLAHAYERIPSQQFDAYVATDIASAIMRPGTCEHGIRRVPLCAVCYRARIHRGLSDNSNRYATFSATECDTIADNATQSATLSECFG